MGDPDIFNTDGRNGGSSPETGPWRGGDFKC